MLDVEPLQFRGKVQVGSIPEKLKGPDIGRYYSQKEHEPDKVMVDGLYEFGAQDFFHVFCPGTNFRRSIARETA